MKDVIGQDYAKHRIAAAIYKHFIVCNCLSENLPQTNIFLCGNSGCGKTYMACKAAEAIGFNVILINCSILTQQGYRGLNLNQAFHNNWKSCNSEEKDKFGQSIIILDEFDKVIDNLKREPRGTPIFDLLPLLDGKYKLDLSEFKENGYVDMSKCMIILTGACYGVRRYKSKKHNSIGFGESNKYSVDNNTFYSEFITEADLIDYGYPTEIMGRISQIININPLNKSNIKEIITNSYDSPFNQYKRFFELHDINLKITDAAENEIAEMVIHKNTGTRAIKTVIEDLLFSEIENACLNKNIKELIISYSNHKGIYVRQKCYGKLNCRKCKDNEFEM